MRHGTWLILSAILGCSGEQGRGQPIIVEPSDEIAGETAPEVMPNGMARQVAALQRPAVTGDYYVGLQPPDLSTATDRTIPSLVFGPGASRLAALVLSEPNRVELRTFPGDRIVEVDLAEGSTGYGNTTTSVLVRPRGALQEGWYTLSVDVPAPVLGAGEHGGRLSSLFRPDSHPILQGVTAGTRDGSRVIEVQFSELVHASLPATNWRIWDDSGALGCEASGPEPDDYPADRATFRCRRSEVGTVHIDFGGVLTTTLGDSVVNLDDEVVTRLAVSESVRPGADGLVSID